MEESERVRVREREGERARGRGREQGEGERQRDRHELFPYLLNLSQGRDWLCHVALQLVPAANSLQRTVCTAPVLSSENSVERDSKYRECHEKEREQFSLLLSTPFFLSSSSIYFCFYHASFLSLAVSFLSQGRERQTNVSTRVGRGRSTRLKGKKGKRDRERKGSERETEE